MKRFVSSSMMMEMCMPMCMCMRQHTLSGSSPVMSE